MNASCNESCDMSHYIHATLHTCHTTKIIWSKLIWYSKYFLWRKYISDVFEQIYFGALWISIKGVVYDSFRKQCPKNSPKRNTQTSRWHKMFSVEESLCVTPSTLLRWIVESSVQGGEDDECLKLQVIFHRRVTNDRALLQKMTYKDKASYGSSPPCSGWLRLFCKRAL